MSQTFEPSLQLNQSFYAEVVEPLIRPFDHAAALLGWGSDILGYDTARSTDHGWGPRLQIFPDEHDLPAVRRIIDDELPADFRGWPTRYAGPGGKVATFVEVLTIKDWLIGQLGLDPREGMGPRDWFSVSQQRILGVVRGAVYADPHNQLADVRRRLTWYPEDVWLWLLASQWQRIGQEEAFVGRTAEVADDLGSRLVAGRLVRELMRLSFLQSKEYWPYTKWFGTAFARLPGAAELTPHFEAAVAATDHAGREAALVAAYEIMARRHNLLGVTTELDPTVRLFHDRPFRVLFAERFAGACQSAVTDAWLRRIPLVGSVDQFVDSTDVLSSADSPQRLRGLFQPANP